MTMMMMMVLMWSVEGVVYWVGRVLHAGCADHTNKPHQTKPVNTHTTQRNRSMAGMLHTAEAFARGARSLRERVSGRWIAPGREWVGLPLLLAR